LARGKKVGNSWTETENTTAVVHTKGSCLDINFIYVAMDGIVLEVNSRLGILVPSKVD